MKDETEGTEGPGLAASLRDSLHDLSAQAREETTHLATDAREEIKGLVRRRKDGVAADLRGVAAALREAGRRSEKEGGEGLGEALQDYAERAAQEVERAANYVRGHEIGEMVRDFEDVAREHPAVFLGGSLLAGLMVARFLKSSGERAVERGWVPPLAEVPDLPELPGLPEMAELDRSAMAVPGGAAWPNAARRP